MCENILVLVVLLRIVSIIIIQMLCGSSQNNISITKTIYDQDEVTFDETQKQSNHNEIFREDLLVM